MLLCKKILSVSVVLLAVSFHVEGQSPVIRFDNDRLNRKIDVLVDGRLFTSLRYSPDQEKPFLYPVCSPQGAVITRGYPLAPREGERTDHPHQIGIWFNYGDVNGLDFWNNSAAVRNKEKYGHIVVTDVSEPAGNTIEIIAEWRDHQENVLLKEKTMYVFEATSKTRIIDHISVLKAVRDVKFSDNKEGLIAVRTDRAFEKPTDEMSLFITPDGAPSEKKIQPDNTGVNGRYYSSEGYEGDEVWSTRNDWVLLTGEKEGEKITFGFFDHPGNIGYPFHAHARGYGLFAVNNLGAQSYNPKEEKLNVSLSKGDSIVFRHRFYLESGNEVTAKKANLIFKEFSGR